MPSLLHVCLLSVLVWSKSKKCLVSLFFFFKASLHLWSSLILLASQQDAVLFKEQKKSAQHERLGRSPPCLLNCAASVPWVFLWWRVVFNSFDNADSGISKLILFLFIFSSKNIEYCEQFPLLASFRPSWPLKMNSTGCSMVPSLLAK